MQFYEQLATKILRKSSHPQARWVLNSGDFYGVVSTLMEADWNFNPEKGPTREIYRKMCVSWYLGDYYKKRKNTMVSIDAGELPLKNLISENNNPEKILIEREEGSRRESKIRSFLGRFGVSPLEKEYIVERFVNGLEVPQIAKKKNVSVQRVGYAISNGLSKINSSYEDTLRILSN